MKKIQFVFFLLSLSLFHVDAQHRIQGRVADVDDRPLAGATVFLPELNKGTVTDDAGEYLISNVPGGKIKIQFSFVGYNTVIKSLEISQAVTRVDVTLTEAVIESQAIVVTGGYVSSQHENAVKIDVLKSKDFVVAGTPDFMKSLTRVPGVDMIAKGPGISKPVIRGLSMNNILVLDNGVRLENYQFSENHPLGIDGNDVERVEIIKGPASLLYGSDAIGGVMNFIKEKPAPTQTVMGDYRLHLFSNTLGMNNSFGIKGASKNVFGGIRFGCKTHADYLQGGGAYVPNTRFHEMTLNVNTGYTGKAGTFKIFYDYFKQDLGMTVPPVESLITRRGRKNSIWYQDLFHHLLSSQNSLYLGRFKWNMDVAYQKALRKLWTTLDIPFVEMNLNTVTYDTKLYFPSPANAEYIVGIQGMLQYNRNLHDRPSRFLPDADIYNTGFLGMAQYTFFGTLKLQGGLRFDSYKTETFALGIPGEEDYHPPVNKHFSNVNGSLGATFHPAGKIILRANVAKAYRVPNLSELTSRGMHGNRYEIGNPDLSPENALETDVSMHFHGQSLSFDLAAFYNHIFHYIFLVPTADTTVSGVAVYRFSQANAVLYGGEAGGRFHPESLPWLHLEGTIATVTGKQDDGTCLPYIPAVKIRYAFWAEWEKFGSLKKPKIKISGLTALSQNRPSPYETPTPGYTLINLSAFAGIPVSGQMLTVGIAVNNLFDTPYIDHLSTLKPLHYYNQGRDITIFLKIPFRLSSPEKKK